MLRAPLLALPLLFASCLSAGDPFESFGLTDGSLYTKSEDGRTEVAFKERGTVTRVELTAEPLLSADGREVLGLPPGGWLAIWDDDRALSFEQLPDGLARTYVVAGKRQDWTPAAGEWLAKVLDVLTRRTAIGARAYGRALLDERGPGALVAGIPALESSTAQAAWVELLLDQPEPEPELLARLVRTSAAIDSTATRAGLLESVARRAPGSAELTRAILESTASLNSSSAQQRVLVELARVRPLTPELAVLAVETTARVASDGSRTEALVALLAAMPVEPATCAAWLEQVCALSSSANQELALQAYIAHAAGALAPLVQAARALPCVASEPRRAELAAILARGAESGPALCAALLDLAAGLSSSTSQERVLEVLITRPELDDATLARLVDVLAGVGSTSIRARLQGLLLQRMRPPQD